MAREEDSGRTGVSRVSKTKRRENVKTTQIYPGGSRQASPTRLFGGNDLSVVLSFFFPLTSAHFVSMVLKSSP